MPWKNLLRKWTESLKSPATSLQVTSFGREPESQTLVCRVDNLTSCSGESRLLSLRFPDGQTLVRPALWIRPSSTREPALVGLEADCGNELRLLDKHPHTRRAPRVAARFWTIFLDGPRTGALTSDLSLEGCRVEGDFQDFLGKEIRLCLELSDASEPLHLRGRIVWAGKEQAGIQFLNLHVFDEVRLLRTLGQVSSVRPSTYLPTAPNSGNAYEYILTPADDGRCKLEILAPNWCFRIHLEAATVVGPSRSTFHQFQLQDSSQPLQRLRARQKICLERPKRLLHLLLKGFDGATVLDVLGEEVGFERQARTQTSIM